MEEDGGCVGHCNVTEYDTFLSYSSLSPDIAQKIKNGVRDKYHHALDIAERVKEASLSRTLNLLTRIGDQLNTLLNRITVNVKYEGTSLFDRMDLCAKKFDMIAREDIRYVYDELQRDLDASYYIKQTGQFVKKKNAETLERYNYLSWRLYDISYYLHDHENIGDLSSRLLETRDALTSFLNETVRNGLIFVEFEKQLSDTTGSYYIWDPPLSDFAHHRHDPGSGGNAQDTVRERQNQCRNSRKSIEEGLRNISRLFLRAEQKISLFLLGNLTIEDLHYLYSDRYGDKVLFDMLNGIAKWNLQVEECMMSYITLLENAAAQWKLVPENYFYSIPLPNIQDDLGVLENDMKELRDLRLQYGREQLSKSELVKRITAEKMEKTLDNVQDLLTRIDKKLIELREKLYWDMGVDITEDYFKVLASAREVQRYNITRYDYSRPYTELKLWQAPEPQLNSENPIQFDEKQTSHMWLDMTLDSFMDNDGIIQIAVCTFLLWLYFKFKMQSQTGYMTICISKRWLWTKTCLPWLVKIYLVFPYRLSVRMI